MEEFAGAPDLPSDQYLVQTCISLWEQGLLLPGHAQNKLHQIRVDVVIISHQLETSWILPEKMYKMVHVAQLLYHIICTRDARRHSNLMSY